MKYHNREYRNVFKLLERADVLAFTLEVGKHFKHWKDFQDAEKQKRRYRRLRQRKATWQDGAKVTFAALDFIEAGETYLNKAYPFYKKRLSTKARHDEIREFVILYHLYWVKKCQSKPPTTKIYKLAQELFGYERPESGQPFQTINRIMKETTDLKDLLADLEQKNWKL